MIGTLAFRSVDAGYKVRFEALKVKKIRRMSKTIFIDMFSNMNV